MVTKLTHAPLHRLLSKLGLASRTQAVQLVGAGRVRVDGQLVLDPQAWAPWEAAWEEALKAEWQIKYHTANPDATQDELEEAWQAHIKTKQPVKEEEPPEPPSNPDGVARYTIAEDDDATGIASSPAAPAGAADANAGGGSAPSAPGAGGDSMAVDAEFKRKANAQNAVEYAMEVTAAAFKKARGQDGADQTARGPAADKACG